MDIEIKITLNHFTGEVSISAPIEQKIICLGLLELAKTQIASFDPKALTAASKMPSLKV